MEQLGNFGMVTSAPVKRTKAAYEQYTEAIEDAVIAGEIVIKHTVIMGIWVDSKTLNRYLC